MTSNDLPFDPPPKRQLLLLAAGLVFVAAAAATIHALWSGRIALVLLFWPIGSVSAAEQTSLFWLFIATYALVALIVAIPLALMFARRAWRDKPE